LPDALGALVEAIRQAWKVARFDLGTAIRTKRAVVAVALYAAAAMGTGALLVWLESKIGDKLQLLRAFSDVNVASHGEEARSLVQVLSEIAQGDEALVRHLLGLPLVVAGFFFVTLTFLPLLVALVSHDIVNAEVRNRSARFVLLRCPRSALLLGKMISHGLLFMAVTVVSNTVLFAYAWWNLPSFEPMTAAGLLLRYWAFTVAFGFCYLSLAALVSSLVDGGGMALITMVLALIGFAWLSTREGLEYLSPSTFKMGLWSPRWATVATSLGAFVAFGAAFLGMAWARLQRRDL
jgi:ABC-type transport system involved in multi-copper enzyme maturation permease subunit